MSYIPLSSTPLFQDADLVAYWSLDGNSNDGKGSLNGTDTSISYVSAKVGQGASFNGTSSKISLGSSAILNFTGDFTINLWLNYTHTSEPYPGIFNAGGYNFIVVDDGSSNTPYFDVGDGLGSDVNTGGSAGSVTPGTFQMLTIRRTSGNAQLLTNGTPSSPSSSYPTNLSGTKIFGENPGRFISGIMDDISIFDRALTNQELSDLYNGNYSTGGFYYMSQ